MINNPYLFLGMQITILALLPLLLYIIPIQIGEVRRPPSSIKGVNRTRKLLLALYIMFVITMVPGIPRAYQLLSVPPANTYAKVVAITNKLPYVIIVTILLVIYKEKED